MTEPALFAIEDRAKILIGAKWFRCRVQAVNWWTHFSGNSYPVYTIEFPNGDTLRCGNNSLRKR